MTNDEINRIVELLAKRLKSTPAIMEIEDAANYLQVDTQFLRRVRLEGYGPYCVEWEGKILYRKSALDTWLEEILKPLESQSGNPPNNIDFGALLEHINKQSPPWLRDKS
jgi:hypothetical protein